MNISAEKYPLKISVITVCLNAVDHIESAMQSVITQEYGNLEYIIIDGASVDGTLQLIDRYKDKIQIIISEPDRGIYDAMNKGIRSSSGEVIYFLNADDKFFDEKVLVDICEDFCQDKNLGLLYGKVNVINIPPGLQPRFDKSFQCNKEFHNRRDLLRQGMCQQNIFCRKWVFEKTGLFDLNYSMNSDYDWFLKAFNNAIPLKYKNRYFCYFNFGGASYYKRHKTVADRIKIVFKNSSLPDFFYYIFCRTGAVFDDIFQGISRRIDDIKERCNSSAKV